MLLDARQICLRSCQSLLGSFAVQHHGLDLILRNTATVSVHLTKICLCPCIALIGSLAEPRNRLSIVFWNALPERIHRAQISLCGRISLLRSSTKLSNCRAKVVGFVIGATKLINEPATIRMFAYCSFTLRNS